MTKYIISLLSAVVLMACGTENKTEQKEVNAAVKTTVELTDAQLKNMTISTGKISSQTISSVLKVNGIIDVPPQNMVSISVPLGGFLKSTKLLPGMHIAKGEMIASMEDQQYIQLQQEYLITASNLKFLEADFKRQKELNLSKATSDKLFQQAEADYQNQKIILKSLYEKLKLIGIHPDQLNENNISRSIDIHSPIDGYVSHVNVNIGKYVNPSDVLFELVNPTDIHLGLTIYEKDLDKIFIGQKLMAYTNHKPEVKFPCEIILIGKDLSAERSVEVHCHFEKYDKTLIPGMFMNADLEINSNMASVLPDEALVRFENVNYAFIVLSKNTFQMVEVKLGNTENGHTEVIMDNALLNKNFVLKGAYNLLMQLKNKEEE
jgi:cobalt-zinc-cadmium efflux system membrane fusion protein